MKIYEAVFEEGENEGIYALSVVSDPAMQDAWIALNEHPKQIELAEVSAEKRLLLGAALIPDKKIYRNIDGNEFYITFKADTIEKLAHNFFKKQNNNNSSLEHEVVLSDMSVVEGWIVEDPKNDKSNAFGKTYEKGTFVTMMKVDNDDVWAKVKSGEITGFSIEALLGLQEINLKSEIEMTEETQKSIVADVIAGVKALFNVNKEEIADAPVVDLTEVEAQPEVEAEPQVEAQPEFDKEAFMQSVIETVKAEFKKEQDEVLSSKDAQIAELEAKLAKQPEEETVSVTPQVAKENTIKFGTNRPASILERVFATLNN